MGAAAVGDGKVERNNGIARVVVARADLLRILDAAVSIPRWRGLDAGSASQPAGSVGTMYQPLQLMYTSIVEM